MSHAKAEGIVRAYLGDAIENHGNIRVFDIEDTDMMGRYILGRHARADCWVVYVESGIMTDADALLRVICILKKTGEIIYDGSEDGR